MPSFATVTHTWSSAPLESAMLAAFPPSVVATVGEQKRTANPSPRLAGAKTRVMSASTLSSAEAVLVPTGLGWVGEKGRKGGYPIYPGGVAGYRSTRSTRLIESGRATAFGDDRFYTMRRTRGGTKRALAFGAPKGTNPGYARYTTGGPTKPDPYMWPAAVKWAQGVYNGFAVKALASRGFGVGNVR